MADRKQGKSPEKSKKPEKKKVSFSDFLSLVKKHKKISIAILAVFSAIILGLTLWGLSALYMTVVDVGDVVVRGEMPYSEEELIEAAEFNMDGKLRDINTKKAEKNILLRLPYIYDVKVRRAFPNRIKITVKCREAQFYTELSGHYFALSQDMIVLDEKTDEEEFRGKLVELRLPEINSAVHGQKIKFGEADADYGYIQSMIKYLFESRFDDALTQIDVANKFEMSFVYKGQYKIILERAIDLDLKLKAAYDCINDERFGENDYLIINASNPSEAIVTPVTAEEFFEITD